jgi:hypothetical protein
VGVLEDMLKALDRIPIWKRLQELPTEVEILKQKVADIEEKSGTKWPGEVCRACGERAARIAHSHVNSKAVVCEVWHCEKCDHRDFRYHKA